MTFCSCLIVTMALVLRYLRCFVHFFSGFDFSFLLMFYDNHSSNVHGFWARVWDKQTDRWEDGQTEDGQIATLLNTRVGYNKHGHFALGVFWIEGDKAWKQKIQMGGEGRKVKIGVQQLWMRQCVKWLTHCFNIRPATPMLLMVHSNKRYTGTFGLSWLNTTALQYNAVLAVTPTQLNCKLHCTSCYQICYGCQICFSAAWWTSS